MPKVIKKKSEKTSASQDVGLQNVLGQIQEKAQKRKQALMVWGSAALAAIVLIGGFYLYRSSNLRQAENNAYQGYRTLAGLDEQEGSAVTVKPEERARKALDLFKKAYDIKPTPYSLYYMGVCQADLGDYASAEMSFGRVVADYPNDTRFVPLALYRLGTTQISAGKNDEALRTFERFKQIGIQAMGDLAIAESARLLDRMGRKEDSINKYKALLLEYPQSPLAKEAQSAVAATEKKAAAPGKKGGSFAPQLGIEPMSPAAIPFAPPAEKK